MLDIFTAPKGFIVINNGTIQYPSLSGAQPIK